MDNKIDILIDKYYNLLISYRRDFHEWPELGFEEYNTATKIVKVLKHLGMTVEERVGKTGVVALLEGKYPGKVVALRADMDALPLQEATDLPFCSKVQNVAHACGHDCHMAILLVTAHILAELKDELAGTVKFIFQPAEECSPTGGAQGMIADQVLENPTVDAIFGLHMFEQLETGQIGSRPGAIMAATDKLEVTIKGVTSHGSEPEQGVDAIYIAAQAINALQSVVARKVAPLDSCVISIGTIRGGYKHNIIADSVFFDGTIRTLNPQTRRKVEKWLHQLLKGVTEAHGGDYVLDYQDGYPATINDEHLVSMVKQCTLEIVGPGCYVEMEAPTLGGEDFAFFGEKVPAVYVWLGCRPKGIPYKDYPPVHNSAFAPDERSLPLGVKLMVYFALNYLSVV